MKILVTGSAGFIGHATASRLLAEGHAVVGIDNLNAYYDVQLKEDRLARLQAQDGYVHHRLDIADLEALKACVAAERPDRVVHLAAQAGVRYSLDHPFEYADANLTGFLNLLEVLRHQPTAHLVFASTSSVYGANRKLPFAVTDPTDHPVSLYAATKKANEVMGYAYSHLFDLPMTGLRFFTVYGPWGRPDMSPFRFAHRIVHGEPIDVYNHGNHTRDFTYVDDIVEGVLRVLWQPPTAATDAEGTSPPYRLYNIGSNAPVKLMDYIAELERAFGRKAELNLLPMQPGDVPDTFADVSDLVDAVGYKPDTSLRDGIDAFAEWYRDYYGVN